MLPGVDLLAGGKEIVDKAVSTYQICYNERMSTYMTELRRTVSHSEVESYLKCERNHYYAYGLEITRRFQSDSLNRGTLGHKALEVYFNTRLELEKPDGDPSVMLTREASVEYAKGQCYNWLMQYMHDHPEDLEIANEVMTCLTFFFEGGGMAEFDILAVEQEYVLQISDTLDLPFVVDLIVRDKQGLIGVVDNKFVRNLYSDRDTELQGQLPKYAAGLLALGYPVNWMAYNEFKWYNGKNETLASKHRFHQINVTPERLKRTSVEQRKVSERIQARKQRVVDLGEQGLWEWSEDAVRTANSLVCNSCSFRALCVAELNDDRPNLVLDREYKKKDRREFTKPVALIEE